MYFWSREKIAMRLLIKKLFVAGAALALMVSLVTVSVADAAVHVNGYYRKNGTYVAPHYRSDPDGIPTNNWSYPGNTNPYTGKTAPGDPNTYLKNYYGGSSGNEAASVPLSLSTPLPLAQTMTQPTISEAERQSLIEKLKTQIVALQLQLQIVMLQSQMNTLAGTP